MKRPPSSRRPLRSPARAAGFTLVELMIAVLVLGVISAVALPTFLDSIRKSRRSEAFAAIASLQQAQERRRSNQASYTTTLSDLGISSSTTSSGYYTLSLDVPSSAANALVTGYVVTAEGRSGTSQANDSQCRKLSVRVIAGSVQYAGCGSCNSFTYAATDPCWKR